MVGFAAPAYQHAAPKHPALQQLAFEDGIDGGHSNLESMESLLWTFNATC